MPGSKKKSPVYRDSSSEASKELLNIQKRYGLSPKDLIALLESQAYDQYKIPLCIFCNDLSSFESITKYLRENCDLKLKEIGALLNRSPFTISSSYRSAKAKHPSRFTITTSRYDVPTHLFAERKLSILETMVHYLSSSGMKLSVIARHLSLDQRTVWTVSYRAKKKLEIKGKNLKSRKKHAKK